MTSLWLPTSPCDASCLPRGAPGVPVWRRAGRLLALAGAMVAGAVLAVASLAAAVLPSAPAARWRATAGRIWARAVLGALGVRLVARGSWPRRHALLVANHVSWLDVLALLAVAPARMLAKTEVRRWPLVGALAAAGGTVFVDRTRPRALPGTVAEVAAALRGGAVVAAFPEGTTWCGATSGRFRPALFQAAIDAEAPVVPVTLSYRSTGDRTAAPAFIGSDTLWASLRRVLAERDLDVVLAASHPIHPVRTADRRILARAAESAVRLPRSGRERVLPGGERQVLAGGGRDWRVLPGGERQVLPGGERQPLPGASPVRGPADGRPPLAMYRV